MADGKRMQDRGSPPVETSRKADSRPRSADIHDLKIAELSSPAVTGRPRSHTEPTGSRIPRIISSIRKLKKSKEIDEQPSLTPADEKLGTSLPRKMSWEGDASEQLENMSVAQDKVNNDETGQDMKPGAAKNMRTRAHTSSFAAPTEASIAKQNEKVELANYGRASSMKEFPSRRPSNSQGLYNAHGDKKQHSRGRKSYRGDEPSERERPSLTMGPRKTYSNDRIMTLDIPDEMQEETETTDELTQEPELVYEEGLEDRRELGQAEVTGLESLREDQDAFFNKLQQGEDRLHSMYKMRDELRNPAVEEQTVDGGFSEGAFEAMVFALHQAQQDREDAMRQLEVLQQELDISSAEIRSANVRAERAERYCEASATFFGTLQKDIERVCKVIDQDGQTMSESSTFDWNTLDKLAQSLGNPGSDPDALHSRFARLVSLFNGITKSLHGQNLQLKMLLSDKEYDLAMAKTTPQRKRKDTVTEMSEEKPAWESDRDTFEKLFIWEQERRRAVEVEYNKLKETAEKWYRPDLERKNRKLQIDLTHAQDDNTALHEKVNKYRGQAQQWENECRLAKTDRETRTAGFEEHIKAQENEILFYIKEYHDKTHDPEHWEMEGLQKKVETLERELHTTNDIFSQTKREKARLEEEVGRLMDANRRIQKDNVRMGRAYITGSGAPTLVETTSSDPGSDDSFSDTASSSSLLWLTSPKKVDDGPKIPRCHSFMEVQKREQTMAQFREEQRRRRQDQDQEDAELEALRRENLGKLYPPGRKGWAELMEKDCWQRWVV